MITVRSVSVIVPTRNRAEQLAHLLPQLMAQDYPRDAFEILVVDNNSTDATRRVVEGLIPTSPVPLRHILEPRVGITYARNRGAQETRFPYLAYCDDDCNVGPDWLGHLMSGFDLDPAVVAVSGLVLLALGHKRPAWLSPRLEPYLGSTSHLGYQTRILENEHVPEFNFAMEKTVWEEAGGFLGLDLVHCSPAASEGVPLLREIRRRSYRVAFVPRAVMYHDLGRRMNFRWLLHRVFSQGISDAMMAEIENHLQPANLHAIAVHTRDFFRHLGHSLFAYLRYDRAQGASSLCSALAYLGRLLGETHLTGDWRRLRALWEQRFSTDGKPKIY